jgi:GTP cyclohydrolase II
MATGMVCQVSSSVNAPFCKPNPQNARYLETKRKKMGHLLKLDE